MAEIVIFWTSFIIMSFPQLVLFFMKKENIENAYYGENNDEDEDDQPEKGPAEVGNSNRKPVVDQASDINHFP